MLYVLGNACRDITFLIDSLPRPGETLNARSTYSGLGGKGLNQAVAAARAGAHVRLIAAIGTDNSASDIRALLGKEDVDTAFLIERTGDTDLSIITVDNSGENTILTNAALAESVTAQDVIASLHMGAKDTLLMQGNLRTDATLEAAKRAKQSGAKLIFNAAPFQPQLTAMAGIDVLVVNAVEALRWTGNNVPEFAIRALPATISIITLGAQGCLLRIGKSEAIALPARASDAKDTTGSGDVFTGMFAAEWTKTGDALRATKLALLAASIAVAAKGAVASVPSREIIAQLRREI